MCGIAGFIGRGDTKVLKDMGDALAHRGPDDRGVWLEGEVGFTHRRLSIIDLSHAGHQPMFSQDQMIAITFNGEIYNYKELRKELLDLGYKFTSETDTEVIIRLYEIYGEDAFARLNGMFAFGLYDKRTAALYLVRDRAGEKPLYWTMQSGIFVFASEPKAIFKHPFISKSPSSDGIVSYLTFDAPLSPASIWRDIYKVPPSSYLKFEKGIVRIHPYWYVPKVRPQSFEDASRKLDRILKQSVASQLVADVPVGVFLSGGLDSSLVTYYAKQHSKDVHTFSLGFSEKSYDESNFAREVAQHLGTTHHEKIVSAEDVRNALPEIVKQLDEPLADPAILPQFLLSKFAREHVTVALGGDGGDELFLGYPTFFAHQLLNWYKKLPLALRESVIAPLVHALPVSHSYLSFDFKAKQFLRGSHMSESHVHSAWLASFNSDESRSVLAPQYRPLVEDSYSMLDAIASEIETVDPLNRASYMYLRTYLVDVLLTKADRASMYNSLEVRAPLLDKSVIEAAFEMPSEFKHQGRTGKYILRKLMEGKLPKKIISRKKHGFGLPVGQWFQNEWKELLTDVLAPQHVQSAGLCNPEEVTKLVEEHINGTHNHRKKLYSLMMLHLWYDFWVR